jgi:hypothetical protein
MKRKIMAAIAAGVLGSTLVSVPAQASWSELTGNRVGFWTISYGDPYEMGRFGALREPDDGGSWGYVLPDWLDYPKSIWNKSDRTIYLYNNPTCNSTGGRWVRSMAPRQKVNSTTGTDWNSIQAFSFLEPTPSRRSCR